MNFSSGQSLSRVQLFAGPWTAARQASLSITNSQLMSIDLMMPSYHLILCHTLLLLPSVFPRIRVFSNELALCIKGIKIPYIFINTRNKSGAFLVAQLVKNLPAMQETPVRCLGQEVPLEKG